jgi:peptide/nickel transport system permease protein
MRVPLTRTKTSAIALTLLLLVIALALLGPLFSPHPPDKPIGFPFSGPSASAPLGTDFLGRDLLSRVLWGGRSVLGLAGAATLLAYAAGLAIGLTAGYVGTWLDAVLMRSADVMLSLPALLFLLVLVTGAGTGEAVLVTGVAAVQMPLIARVIRAATLEQSVRGFVEAAIARGEKTIAILRLEILPNIMPVIMADVGLRFTYSIILIASVNFLGLGLQPPSADWGLIISENRIGLTSNPFVIIAPALLIAVLTVTVSLIGDGVARSLGISTARKRVVR